MKTIKHVFVLVLTVVFSLPSLHAQEWPAVWNADSRHYIVFDEWNSDGDQVAGKVRGEYNRIIYLTNEKVELGGKEYYVTELTYDSDYAHEVDVPGQQRVQNYLVPLERSWYSIGVRWEDGRVYTNYEDYVYYQTCRLTGNDQRPNFQSLGDPNYLPYHLSEDSTELILYDYTMEVGDSYRHVEGYDNITVVKKEQVVLSGDDIVRRRLTLSNGLILIEGIGCINSNGMLQDYLNPDAQYSSRYTYLARGYKNGGNVVYDYEKDSGLQIINLNTQGVEETPLRHHASERQKYDLQGRRLKEAPQKGIYIENGTKKIAGGRDNYDLCR